MKRARHFRGVSFLPLCPALPSCHPVPLSRSSHSCSRSFLRTLFSHLLFLHPKPQRARLSAEPLCVAELPGPGTVVEHVSASGVRVTGEVVGRDGKRKVIVQDARGSRVSLAMNELTYIVGTGLEGIQKVQQRLRELKEGSEGLLGVAWEMMEGGGRVPVSDVAEVLFGSGDAVESYAAWTLAVEDGLYFRARSEGRVDGGAWLEARSTEVVKAEMERRDRKERENQLWKEVVNSGEGGKAWEELVELVGKGRMQEVISALVSVAEDLYEKVSFGYVPTRLDEKGKKLAAEWLLKLGKPFLPTAAFETLVGLGKFWKHENVALRKTIFANGHPDEVKEAASKLSLDLVEDKDAGNRLDLRRLAAYAIDSADTTEIDDAISLDRDNHRVWVHIADATRFFGDIGVEDRETDIVMKEALKRGATLYLPTASYTMLPTRLASKMSLSDEADGEASPNLALSFGFHIETDGSIDASDVIIKPSIISRVIRHTYEELDKILEEGSNDDLSTLEQSALRRLSWRQANGAIVVDNPLSYAQVEQAYEQDPEPIIRLSLIQTQARSWRLVTEMMMTANTLAGSFFAEYEIPAPFRGQKSFDLPDSTVLESIPEGPARTTALFRYAEPSRTTVDPMPHASIGVEAYVQVTSPIRRSLDTLAHLQLKAHLRNERLPFDREHMSSEISRFLERLNVIQDTEYRTKRYWELEYLRRAGPEAVYPAVVLRFLKEDDDRVASVSLDNLGIRLVAKIPYGTNPGAKVAVRVSHVDPMSGFVRAVSTLWVADREDISELQNLEKQIDMIGKENLSELVPTDAVSQDISSELDVPV